MKTLIVVDMQKDFLNGSLATEEALRIIPAVERKIKEYKLRGDEIIFTRDTHTDDYLNTNEGRHLPIVHCVKNTDGWEIPKFLDIPECEHIDKPTFGWDSWDLVISESGDLKERHFEEIEIVGVCTDICVVSNALILKALFPEIKISVDAGCCAGTTPENHQAALTIMKMCQIEIKE